ncbi:MAG: diaminopimelate epimerase, partial [Pseudomonadota bacterium]
AVALCDRYRGIGADGVLEPMPPTEKADYAVRIWNPDGSVAEKSGNGLRIFARWLSSERGAGSQFTVSTGPCTVACRVTEELISIEMGQPTFEPSEVPVLASAPLIDGELAIEGAVIRATAVGIGNPHCVSFWEEPLDTLPWRLWGASLERHAWFPNRTNVQFARVVGPGRVEIRIWERGAGETQASGSSSCAVAAAAVRTGRLAPGRITVEMPGGTLWVTVASDGVLLEGPVEPVARCEIDPRWLAARQG